jgi:hypothetical protein
VLNVYLYKFFHSILHYTINRIKKQAFFEKKYFFRESLCYASQSRAFFAGLSKKQRSCRLHIARALLGARGRGLSCGKEERKARRGDVRTSKLCARHGQGQLTYGAMQSEHKPERGTKRIVVSAEGQLKHGTQCAPRKIASRAIHVTRKAQQCLITPARHAKPAKNGVRVLCKRGCGCVAGGGLLCRERAYAHGLQ